MKKAGIYIGRDKVIACVVSLSRGKPVIHKYAVEPIEKNIVEKAALSKPGTKQKVKKSPIAIALRKAVQKIGAKHKNITMAFSPLNLVTRYFEMPWLPPQEQKLAVPFEANRYLPYRIEDTISDYTVHERVGEGKKKFLGVTFASVKADFMRQLIQNTRDAGIKPAVIEPVYCALARPLGLIDRNAVKGGVGMMHFDTERDVHITLAANGITYVSHDFSLPSEEDMAETRLARELKASMEHVSRIVGKEVMEKIFISGAGNLLRWQKKLRELFSGQVDFQQVELPGSSIQAPSAQAMLYPAVGLALRSFRLESPVGQLRLISQAEIKTNREVLKNSIMIEFLIISVLFAFGRLAMEPRIQSLKTEASQPAAPFLTPQAITSGQLPGELEQLNAEALEENRLPDGMLKLESIESLQARYNEIQSNLTQINLFTTHKFLLEVKLRFLATTKPSIVWLDQVGFGEKASVKRPYMPGVSSGSSTGDALGRYEMNLQGYAFAGDPEKEIESIHQWTEKMRQSASFMKHFHKVEVVEMKRGRFKDQDITSFRIRIE